jgi:hypothetical protein
MLLVPQNYGRYFKNLINEGRVFARFVASQKGTPKELQEQIRTRLAELIDSWSSTIATFAARLTGDKVYAISQRLTKIKQYPRVISIPRRRVSIQ